MKDKVYKRKQVKWYELINNCLDLTLQDNFKSYLLSHPYMSENRCAYNVLKKYYSTTVGHNMSKLCLDLARLRDDIFAYKKVFQARWC